MTDKHLTAVRRRIRRDADGFHGRWVAYQRRARCRFCEQTGNHWCPGGPLQPGDRAYDLFGDTRAFPGIATAMDHRA